MLSMVEKHQELYMSFLISELEQYFTEHISVHEVGMQDILRIRAIQEDPLEDASGYWRRTRIIRNWL